MTPEAFDQIKNIVAKLRPVVANPCDASSLEQLNLAAWVGERSQLLIDEIERLRGAKQKLQASHDRLLAVLQDLADQVNPGECGVEKGTYNAAVKAINAAITLGAKHAT
jgi:hypothetical protein